MKRLIIALCLIFLSSVPVQAAEFVAPQVPESGEYIFPDESETFGEGLWKITKEAIAFISPSMSEALSTMLQIIAAVLITSITTSLPGSAKKVVDLVSTLSIGGFLLQSSNTLTQLGLDTVEELSSYGKLLLPVMTAAVAAQGGASTSATLYTGTAIFDAVLCTVISRFAVPMMYIFIALSCANSVVGEDTLKKIRDFVKWLIIWCLKIILYVFTGYMSISGVVSGSADAAAVKATKLTISGMVPVIGGILSDASETILVGAGIMKSAAGVYGLLAIISVCIGPFIKIGVQYIMLKLTAAVCQVIGTKQAVNLIQDFSSAMGMILAMTGTVCLLLMISIVCFMKGVG